MKIKHVKGNVLRLEIPLTIKRKELVDGQVVEHVENFYPCSDYPTYINFKKSLTIPFEASVQGNLARMQDNGTLNVGTYQIEVLCYDEAGEPYRYMVRDVVEIVDATADADIEEGVEFNAETYTLEGAVFISYGVEQVQADWTETDIHSKAYINNKPTNLVEDESYVHTDNNYADEEKEKLADLENYDDSGIRQELDGKVDKITGKGLSANDYTTADKDKLNALPTNSELATLLNGKADTADLAEVATSGSYNDLSNKPDLSGFITNSVDNLVNYYLKSETYTKTEVQQLIGALQMFHYEIYAELPQSGAGNVLYLIGPTGSGSDKYEEYVYADDTFTKIGDTSIDLSGYVTTSALNITLRDYVTSATLTVLLASKADKSEMSVVSGTGADADKTTITLKQGTSATVLTSHQNISGKEDVTNIVTPVNTTDATLPITTLTCEVGKYYRIDVAVDTLGVTLPAMTDLTTVRTVVICLTAGTTPAVTITATDNKDVYYQDGFEIEAGNTYEINALFNGAAWIVAAVKINVE